MRYANIRFQVYSPDIRGNISAYMSLRSQKLLFSVTHIAEVIINENVEMTLVMVKQYHEFLLSNLVSPFSLLIINLRSG
ncbi:hypothetical protein SAMN02745724_05243 [Pseudoalteromonas denitrificans DSM 6059]|uniref:Uncharacterized protein n=1 Tax=Pseudoalteromonas denitrificans DSM 6059 TaxID=1123010 RepID=A0A1I1UIF3_9GAMM|nr:hypothetical protein SAMN02745724_05243 [Pseudoalteromonas denitrificans DSM 6059]